MAGKWLQNANEKMKKKGTKGSFSRWAQKKGMSTKQAANTVMDNPDEYSGKIRKKANFAKNAMNAGQ